MNPYEQPNPDGLTLSEALADWRGFLRGPWDDEPDFALHFHRGLPLFIGRHSHTGHLCGYVGVRKGHRFYGKGYFEVMDTLSCEEELTYAGTLDFWSETIPTLAGYWYFGFDYAHLRDMTPQMAIIEGWPRIRKGDYRDHIDQGFLVGTYKTFPYALEQAKKLANLLAPVSRPFPWEPCKKARKKRVRN